MIFLKQSTSVVVQFGPFVDKTDGVSLEVGLATAMDNATTGIRLSKNGAVYADRGDATAPAYDAMGSYRITLSATDTNTLGALRMTFEEAATCLPHWADFMVMPANAWDSLFGADALDVNVAQWLGAAAATPTTAGVPEVDVTHVSGTLQTAGDVVAELAKVPKSDGTSSWNSTALAAINAEVDTALNTAIPGAPTAGSINDVLADVDARLPASGTLSTFDETAAITPPGQEAPTVNQTAEQILAYLYKAWRNRTTQTATEYSLYADNATTVDHKATVSDNGTTFDKGEAGSGA